MSTSLEQELLANQCWKLKANDSRPRFDEVLLRNEFLAAPEQRLQKTQGLRHLLQHCYDIVPYYRELFQREKISRRHLRDASILARIPILEKAAIEQHTDALQTRQLWPGHKQAGSTQTSGTTGQPTIIQHSDYSLGMFRWLKQREYRWFRFDPRRTLLSIRPAAELPRMPDGSYIPEQTYLKLAAWPTLGGLFETGAAWAFNNTNLIGDQVSTVNQIKPAYLVTQSSNLEFLSLQKFAPDALQHLEGVLAISHTLTPAMRSLVENNLQIPVQQNYGLNEIGLIASRCPEGGRYHVHAEHCVVEIVKPDGSVCAPGETGKLLVTALNNPVMPLLRYDADDLAEAVEGPCSCGRTLPSFGAVQGRYRRIAYLPEGTWQRWAAIQMALYEIAARQKSAVRKYQAYQDQQGHFSLRIDCEEAVFAGVAGAVSMAYEQAFATLQHPNLEILRTDQFLGEGGRKFQNFISEFTPEPDR